MVGCLLKYSASMGAHPEVIVSALTRILPCPSRACPASHECFTEGLPDMLVGAFGLRDDYGLLCMNTTPCGRPGSKP